MRYDKEQIDRWITEWEPWSNQIANVLIPAEIAKQRSIIEAHANAE